MNWSRGIGWTLVLAASCVAVTLAWAESPKEDAAPMRRQSRMQHGQHQPLHAEMKAKMQAHDARLDELVTAMNAAEGEAKIDAVAAVVNELIAQRRTRRAHIDERWNHRDPESGEKGEGTDAP